MSTAKSFAAQFILLLFALFHNGAFPAGAQPKDELTPREPSFNAAATRVVYVVDVKKAGELLPSTSEIWVVNGDGRKAKSLTSAHKDIHPRLNPDGSQIVFTRDNDIWMINADGSGLHNFTNTPNAKEDGADFTNDGKAVVFLRATTVKSQLDAEIIKKEPLAALGGTTQIHSVVLKHLATGAERTILHESPTAGGDNFGIEQVIAVPFDDNALFVVCRPLDNDGKPRHGIGFTSERVVAVLKLDGAPPRQVAHLQPESKMTLKRLRVSQTLNIAEVEQQGVYGKQLGLLQDGRVTPLPGVAAWGDISRDGKKIITTGIADDKFNFGLLIHDIATKKTMPFIELEGQPTQQAKALFKAAEDHFHSDRHSEAISEVNKALMLHPDYPEALVLRGRAYDWEDDEKAALRDYGEAIRLHPNYAEAYIWRAHIYKRQERFGEALDDYSAAIKANPKDALAYYYRGQIYQNRLDFNEALADYNESLKLSPKDLSALMARASVQAELGDNAGAVADYSTAIEKFPKYYLPYEKRAKIYRSMGKAELALADEQKIKEFKNK